MRAWCLILLVLFGTASIRAEEPPVFAVPYRLTATHHILVRAKLNGKGPYHFLLDTGAPALYVGTALGRKLDLAPDRHGWAKVDRFEIEGGVVSTQIPARIEDPFQIEGMNQLRLAEVELHGILGHQVLAAYRIELDLTRDKMRWTRLAGEPPPLPEVFPAGTPAEPDGLSRLLLEKVGRRGEIIVKPRGFLGVELDVSGETAAVRAVLPDSPAAAAGLRAGDVLVEWQGEKVPSGAEVLRRMAGLVEEEVVRLTVRRGGRDHALTVRLGKGL